MTTTPRSRAIEQTLQMFESAHIMLTTKEKENIEIADFGLDDYPRSGLQLLTYINSSRYCAKELVLFPRQTCPEHRHPPFDQGPGKQETFRCRWGEVYLFVDDDSLQPNQRQDGSLVCRPPENFEKYYTCQRYILLNPGEQYTIAPNTRHWFQAGGQGAVISEFSSASRDEFDIFTDPDVVRASTI